MAGKVNAASWLTQYFLQKNDLANAKVYSSILIPAFDSVSFERKEIQTAIAHSQHKNDSIYKKLHEEQVQLYKGKKMSELKEWIWTIVSCTVLIVAIVLGKKISLQKKLLRQRDEDLEQNTKDLDNARNELMKKEIIICKKDQELIKQNHFLREFTRIHASTYINVELKQIVCHFMNLVNSYKQLQDNDWEVLMAVVNREAPTFSTVLNERMERMTEPLIKTAYLLKVGFNNVQISILMGAPRQTVWDRTRKLQNMPGHELSPLFNFDKQEN